MKSRRHRKVIGVIAEYQVLRWLEATWGESSGAAVLGKLLMFSVLCWSDEMKKTKQH